MEAVGAGVARDEASEVEVAEVAEVAEAEAAVARVSAELAVAVDKGVAELTAVGGVAVATVVMWKEPAGRTPTSGRASRHAW